jgi:hypothetical protein
MEAGRALTWVLQMHAGTGKQASRAAFSPPFWGAPVRKGTCRGAAGPAPAWRSHRRWGHAESSAAMGARIPRRSQGERAAGAVVSSARGRSRWRWPGSIGVVGGRGKDFFGEWCRLGLGTLNN